MTTARKNALRRTWRAIAAPAAPQFALPVSQQFRTIAFTESPTWHAPTNPRSTQPSQGSWKSDPIPFVVVDSRWESTDETQNDSRSTLSKSERAAFARLFDMVGSGSAPPIRKVKKNFEPLAEGRRKSQERADEVLSILEQAFSHARKDHPTTPVAEEDRGKIEESPLRREISHEEIRPSLGKGDEATAVIEGVPDGAAHPRLSEQEGSSDEIKDAGIQADSTQRSPEREGEASQLPERPASDQSTAGLASPLDVHRFPGPLKRMAAEANERTQRREEWDSMADQYHAQPVDVDIEETHDPMAAVRKEQHARIADQLRAASSDWDLWRVLRSEVFSVIARLELDGPNATMQTSEHLLHFKGKKPLKNSQKPNKSKKKGKEFSEIVDIEKAQEPFAEDEKMTQLAIIGPNYPSLLLIAMKELRERFPGSTLPFSMLPTIKSFGRSSYVLGAGTGLYNELISAYYTMYLDLDAINTLLIEMENAGLEFDERTFEIVDEIRVHGNAIMRAGKQRQVEKLVWSTDMVQNGWRRVIGWVPVIRERLRAADARRAEEARELGGAQPV